MSSRQNSIGAPVLPQVNLLPPEVRAARGLRVVQRWLVLGLIVVIVLIGLGYVYAGTEARSADRALVDARAETDRLLAEQARYAPVLVVIDQLTTTDAARRVAAMFDVPAASYLGAIAAVTPEDVTIETVTLSGGSPLLAPPEPANVLIEPGVGIIDLMGRSPDMPDTVAWARALDGIPGLRDAWITATEVDGDDEESYFVVTASIQVDLSAVAKRFDPIEEVGDMTVPSPDDEEGES